MASKTVTRSITVNNVCDERERGENKAQQRSFFCINEKNVPWSLYVLVLESLGSLVTHCIVMNDQDIM